MKKILFILTLAFTFNMQAQAQTQTKMTDLQAIEITINNYFDGLVNHNPESLKKAFEPKATMKWIEKGAYTEVNAVEALVGYVTANKPAKTKASIVAVNVIGDAANAQLHLEFETFSYTDFMHLLKIKGEWKIVSKTYTTVQKDF